MKNLNTAFQFLARTIAGFIIRLVKIIATPFDIKFDPLLLEIFL